MSRCGYKKQIPYYGEWECPLDALTGEEYCYWHKEDDEKEPTKEQLEELKENTIMYVYLQKSDLIRANLSGSNLSWANLSGSNLSWANLSGSNLFGAKLQGANLYWANLQKSDLTSAKLQGANLYWANLQKSDLTFVKLQGANLSGTKFNSQTVLDNSKLIGANLFHSYFDEAKSFRNANVFQDDDKEINEVVGDAFRNSRIALLTMLSIGLEAPDVATNLRESRLTIYVESDEEIILFDRSSRCVIANLKNWQRCGKGLLRVDELADTIHKDGEIQSKFLYNFDEAKSFRNANVFQDDDKEINEVVGDAFRNSRIALLTMLSIGLEAPDVATNLRESGLTRYVESGGEIILFDTSSRCVIENLKNWQRRNWWRSDKGLIRVNKLADTLLKDGEIQPKFLYTGSRTSLYDASYEVYNNLYNFYVANGRLDQAAHVHYRRGEAHRKLRWVSDGGKIWNRLNCKMRSIFDFVILRTLTGYGDRIRRPIICSGIIIGLFAALFWLCDGIVKNVNGIPDPPDEIDYIYHSITTFTSLGYSNIQPNLEAGHLPQVLVAAESGLGILMTALIIFVITYQVSR